MRLRDVIADGLVSLYGLNRRTLQFRGAYRLLRLASKALPKLRAYPIYFSETAVVHADVNDPDTFWLLNAFVGDLHHSIGYLVEVADAVLVPGDVVWDVGGSMGLFSSQLAQKRFGLKSIYLFEPHPNPFRIAKGLLESKPVMHLYPFGLGSSQGTADLYFGAGTGSASLKRLSEAFSHHVTCQIETGDALVAEGKAEPPTLIKIDVEGFEIEVLKGLHKTIASARPVVLFEILFLADADVLDIVPKDYRIAFIDDKNGRLLKDLGAARKESAMDAVMAPHDSKLWLKLESKFVDA